MIFFITFNDQELLLPKFSIITVAYNSEKTIERTIQSVLSQTFIDFEYIIIDGLSSDSTIHIANRYKEIIPTLIVVSEKDTGIYNAMNKGARISSGEYLLFLNSEDYYEENFLELIASEIIQKPSDCYIGDIFAHTDDLNYSISNAQLDEIFFRMPFNHQGSIINRTVFMKLNGYDERLSIAADWDLFLRAYIQHHTFTKYSGCHVHFYYGGVSSTTDYEYEKEYIIKKNLFPSLNVIYSDIKLLFKDDIFTDSMNKRSVLKKISESQNSRLATDFLYAYSSFLNRCLANEITKIKSKKAYRLAEKIRKNYLIMKIYHLFY